MAWVSIVLDAKALRVHGLFEEVYYLVMMFPFSIKFNLNSHLLFSSMKLFDF